MSIWLLKRLYAEYKARRDDLGQTTFVHNHEEFDAKISQGF